MGEGARESTATSSLGVTRRSHAEDPVVRGTACLFRREHAPTSEARRSDVRIVARGSFAKGLLNVRVAPYLREVDG